MREKHGPLCFVRNLEILRKRRRKRRRAKRTKRRRKKRRRSVRRLKKINRRNAMIQMNPRWFDNIYPNFFFPFFALKQLSACNYCWMRFVLIFSTCFLFIFIASIHVDEHVILSKFLFLNYWTRMVGAPRRWKQMHLRSNWERRHYSLSAGASNKGIEDIWHLHEDHYNFSIICLVLRHSSK